MAVPAIPEGLDPALAARFEAIRKQFVAGLAARQRDIDAAPDREALDAALHRLAGAAGGYGYGELGQLARQALQAGDASALAASLALLRQAIDRLAG